MKKQTVFGTSKLSAFMQLSCATMLLFILSACGSGVSGGDRSSGEPVSVAVDGNDSGNFLAIKLLAANDGVNGSELWKTDGTAAGTVLVKDINPATGAGSNPGGFTEYQGAFYFGAYDDVYGYELWKTDGTAAGTVLVKDINPASGGGSGTSSEPTNFIVFNGALYFKANDGVNSRELWKTDGTAAGTVLVKDINPAPGVGSIAGGFNDLTVFNGALYFRANDGVNGDELWKTDGTASGTVLVKDINTAAGVGSYPNGFTEYNGLLYFQAGVGPENRDGLNNYELWKTDGTNAGTVLVKEINTATGMGSYPAGFTVYNGELYFGADDGVHGYELWKTDGSDAGTVLVLACANLYAFDFTVLNGVLYFSGNDGVKGEELWKTDGTDAGTLMVKDINTTAGGDSFPRGYIVFNDALFFTADDGVNGRELWKSDGTDAGTVLVKDVNPAPGAGSFSGRISLTVFNGALLYFTADEGDGRALWKSDGTAAGTQLIADFPQ